MSTSQPGPRVPPAQPSADAVYAAVTARRTQFDNLLWQVPALCLTAQAFLFTIALGPDTSRVARTVACTLAVVASFLTVHLMTRHRQAEITDAEWLSAQEQGLGIEAHGPEWRRRRDATSSNAWVFSPLARLAGYRTWAVGLSIFGLAAVFVLVVTWAQPEWLT